jgi:hypothetical protein
MKTKTSRKPRREVEALAADAIAPAVEPDTPDVADPLADDMRTIRYALERYGKEEIFDRLFLVRSHEWVAQAIRRFGLDACREGRVMAVLVD